MTLLGALSSRPLRALQVEVTSRCTRRCAVCPRSALADRWREEDLSMARWNAIVPGLALARHVHLQGWGEPLLHPDLPDMAAAAKEAGCAVGITTNGDLLDTALDWLQAVRADIVSVSVGGGAGRHERLRDGSRLASALAAAGELAARAGRGGRPRVQVSFLLTWENAGDLEEVVRLAARHRIHDVFTVHLDCTPSRSLLDLAAFTASGLRAGVAEALASASAAATECGVRLRQAAAAPDDLLTCALDPTRFAYVAADGRVGPCSYLVLPMTGPIQRVDFEGATKVEPVIYGSVPEARLDELLSSPKRRRFIATFAARLAAEKTFLESVGGLGTTALAGLEAADEKRTRTLADNRFPRACARCHKRVGW
jgi:MoaA/NifB/PqqE/SkfB family radical SAM enzyme